MQLTGDDMREGLTCVLSVKMPDPKFSSQTKDKLVSSEVTPIVSSVISEELARWFEEHPQEAKIIIAKDGRGRATAREAARKARELTRRKGALDIANRCRASLPIARSVTRRFPNCSSSRVTAAGGSAKQGRDADNFRPFCRFAGKILNVERARLDKILGSQEIGTLLTALGTSIGATSSMSASCATTRSSS